MLSKTSEMMIAGVYKTYGLNVGDDVLDLWDAALGSYTEKQIVEAIVKYTLNGLKDTAPTPGKIRDIIEGRDPENDGRPTAEEAWAIIKPIIGNETRSACITTEMGEPWNLAERVWPDEVGARMAFKDAYNRITRQARDAGEKVHWWITAGSDPHENAQVRLAAIADGRISSKISTSTHDILVDGRVETVTQLHGPMSAMPSSITPHPDEVDKARDRLLADAQRAQSGAPRLTDSQHEKSWKSNREVAEEQIALIKKKLGMVGKPPKPTPIRSTALNVSVPSLTIESLRDAPALWESISKAQEEGLPAQCVINAWSEKYEIRTTEEMENV